MGFYCNCAGFYSGQGKGSGFGIDRVHSISNCYYSIVAVVAVLTISNLTISTA